MSETKFKRLSHRELVQSFVDAARSVQPQFEFLMERSIPQGYAVPGFTPDIVAVSQNRRLAIECKSITVRDRILGSIYTLIGVANLHPSSFDRFYIVLPAEAAEALRLSLPEKMGIISYTVQERVRFHVIRGQGDYPPNFSTRLRTEELVQRIPAGVDITAPKSFRIARGLLERSQVTQSILAEEEKVSLGLVNKVVSYLASKRIVEVGKKGVSVNEPWKLLNEIALKRPLESLKLKTIPSTYSKAEAAEAWVLKTLRTTKSRYALAGFTAARRYTSYFRLNDVVQLYAEDLRAADLLEKRANTLSGGKPAETGVRVEVYRADIPEIVSSTPEIPGIPVTSRIQTVIDLVCLGPRGYELATILLEGLRK